MGIGNWLGKRVRLTDGNFWRGFFGIESWSGEDVSVERALQLDAVWGCVRLVAGTVGTLPCMVYENDGSTPARGHSLYELLHDAPNLDDTAAEFWETVVLCLMLYGNSYGEIKRNGEGTIVAIDLLHPDTVKVERTSPRNERVYRIREDGKTRTLRDRQMFHVRVFKMPGCDVGMSPVSFARQSIGSALAAEKTTGRMFSNGMQTAGVLTANQVLTQPQREQIGEIMRQYVGSDKAGKLMVLEAGMKYERLTLTPEDAQMLDTRRFNVESICRWFGVPPVMIGHAAQGITTWGSGVEQIILQFTKTGLRQVVNQIEAAIRRDLLSKDERKTLDVKFNLEGLLRGDSASRAALYSTMVQNGVYSRNHARKLENLPSVDGADVLTVQSNLVPLDQLGKPDATTPARQLESGLAALIGEAVDRALAGAPATTARDKDHQP